MNNFHIGIFEGASASSFFIFLCFFFALCDNWGSVLKIYVTSVVHFSLWHSSLVVLWDAIVYILYENKRLLTEGIKLFVPIHLES